MVKAEDLEMAGEFASSMRGRFIVAQALHYAILELDKVEGVWKEMSNIADMKYLRKYVYNFPIEVMMENRMEGGIEYDT